SGLVSRWGAQRPQVFSFATKIVGAAARPIATQGRSYRGSASLDSKAGPNLRQSRILRMPIMKKQAHLHH
ncbi:hypothetical protein, partial [Pseudomonas inefficax]|uniref:hypothetical protein n=1 Tax=Pseudomonas inefficax TaxID=2078786 RepID=UPI002DB96AAD